MPSPLVTALAAPFRILQAAIRAVPAVKYALGIAGIVATVSLTAGLGLDFRAATLGAGVMLVLMTLLLVFAKLSTAAVGIFRIPMIVLLWLSIALFCSTAVFICTSVFFQWPLPLRHWLLPGSHSYASADNTNVDIEIVKCQSWKLPPGNLYRSLDCELRVINRSDLDVPIDPDGMMVVSGDDGALRSELMLEISTGTANRGAILPPNVPVALYCEGRLADSVISLLDKGKTAYVQLWYDRGLTNQKVWYVSSFFDFSTSQIEMHGD